MVITYMENGEETTAIGMERERERENTNWQKKLGKRAENIRLLLLLANIIVCRHVG